MRFLQFSLDAATEHRSQGWCAASTNQITPVTFVLTEEEVMVEVQIRLPEEIAITIQNGGDLSRRVLEMTALEGFKSGMLTTAQLQRMLGFESRFDVDGFLKDHDVFFDYSHEDLAHEEETSRILLARRA
jgi:Uncharacterised protein family (UPF0175)